MLDAGNWLVGDRDPARATQGRTSVEVLNQLDYDAAALGSSDLALGTDVLRQRIAEANFPVLSANAFDNASGDLLAEPYTVAAMDDHHVAVIGISGPTSASSIRVAEPVAAARDAVAEVGKQADVVIILSNAGEELNRQIAAEVSGVDLVIAAAGQARGEPLTTDNAILLQADQASLGHAGRVVGVAELHFDKQGAVADIDWQRVTLTPEFPDDPAMRAWIDQQS